MPHSIEELEKSAQRVQTSLGATPQLCMLFKYLWEHLDEHVGHRDIWEKGELRKVCRSKDKDQPFDPKKPTEGFDFRHNIRQAALDLRDALKCHFKKHPEETWCIDLPNAEYGNGYQLRCIRVANDFKVTGAFWRPHLQGANSVSVVYVEHLFYYESEKRRVFRYYDCNEEHNEAALLELYRRHGDTYQADPNGSLRTIYPYIAKGEAQALHLLSRWFGSYAAVQLQLVTSRDIHYDDLPEEDSVLLFGSVSSNRFIRRVLERHSDADITLESRTRVRLLSPKSGELQRIAELERNGCCRKFEEDGSVIIEFADEKSWPGILSRLPSPYTNRTPTTIFNSDYGTAVHALTAILTDEDRLTRGLRSLNIPISFIEYFQFLYCVDAVRHDKKPRIQAIAWRPYELKGI
jgi:hypothetical protein